MALWRIHHGTCLSYYGAVSEAVVNPTRQNPPSLLLSFNLSEPENRKIRIESVIQHVISLFMKLYRAVQVVEVTAVPLKGNKVGC